MTPLTRYVRRDLYEAVQVQADNLDRLRALAEADDYVQLTPDDRLGDPKTFPVQILTRSGWIGLMRGTWLVRDRADVDQPFPWRNLSDYQFRSGFTEAAPG